MAVINNAEAYPPRGDYKEMSFQEELEQILRSEFYVNEHDDCDDSCSKKWYSNEAFKRALTSITNLVDKEVIGEEIKLNAHIDDELLSYVPDMHERSLEVTGVSSAFTTLYTRALVQQVQEAQRNKLRDGE